MTLSGMVLLTALVALTTPGDSTPAITASTGDPGAPRSLTLEEASALALQNAPDRIRAAGELRARRAAVRSAYGRFLPGLSVSGGASRRIPAAGDQTRVENGQVITLPDEPWSYNVGMSASLQLFAGGQRLFALRQARVREDAAEVSLSAGEYTVLLDVKQRFFDVLAARESGAAARAQLVEAEQQRRDALSRYRARSASRSDSLRAEIQVNNARLAVMESANALRLADASLTRSVGTPYSVTASDTALPAVPLELDEGTLLALAEEGPAVREARSALEAARIGRRIAWTDYLPALSLGYSRGGSGTSESFSLSTDDYSYNGSLRLSMSFPLFDQFQREEQVVVARVAELNAEAMLRDARLAARASLVEITGAFRSATERIAVQAGTVAAAEEDLRVQRQRYGLGAATLLDVLTSVTLVDQARRDLIRARYDQRVALARLEALVGRSL